MKLKTALVISSLFIANSAWSQWSGEGDLAFSSSSGNSDTSSLAAALSVTNEHGQWKHNIGFDAVNSIQDDTTTGEAYTLAAQSDYSFSGPYSAFAGLRYQADRFSGFDSQASITAGLGWSVISNERTSFDANIGIGFRESELTNGGETESEAVGRLSLAYKHSLTETTDLDLGFLTESGSSNTYAEISASIRVAISDALGLRAGYLIRNNSDAPAGSTSTDTLTTVGINYSF